MDLIVAKGDFIALLGPSGCGKSSLLNLLGCLDRPSSGELLIDGIPVSSLDDDGLARLRNQKIGFVFQHYHLLPRMSALRNVELPMMYAGVSPEQRRERALQGLERVHLSHRLDHTPSMLSGGESQRVAIARALVMNPSLVLADEPTGNLDTRTGEEIMQLFELIHRDGTTLVMVTHSPEMAERATRILRLRDGRIESET
ncbi:ABC transporter ATP-binding protein [bacterium]|nr:ABC transporter ATP-binding protein [bacterium]